jgi:hypothetical protein
MADKERKVPQTREHSEQRKTIKGGGGWVKRDSGTGRPTDKPSNLGGDTGEGGSGDPPKRGE